MVFSQLDTFGGSSVDEMASHQTHTSNLLAVFYFPIIFLLFGLLLVNLKTLDLNKKQFLTEEETNYLTNMERILREKIQFIKVSPR